MRGDDALKHGFVEAIYAPNRPDHELPFGQMDATAVELVIAMTTSAIKATNRDSPI